MPIDDLLLGFLARHPELRVAYLFGSLASGRAGPESDLDLAVGAVGPLSVEARMTLVGELAELLGRPVDLVDLARVGEPLLGQILAHGRRLAGDDRMHAELIRRHVLDEADFLPYRRRILAERRHAWTGT